MTFEKALSIYRNDKTLQILRAEHFPLLVSFFHLAFKQLEKQTYTQSALISLLGDFLNGLERQGFKDYLQPPVNYLQKWAQQGYMRRYYETTDEPIYELSPASVSALRWLEDLNKQQFVGTHSRLLQFFSLLQNIVNKTAGPYERMQHLLEERKKIDAEIENIKQGRFEKPSDTLLKEEYFLAEETARRLLSDFRQVEENFRELDTETRQKIIKSNLAKGVVLDNIFEQQDFLWNTDQGKSFKAFWEFLMSESMQQELEDLIQKLNDIPSIKEVKQEQIVDRIKYNLVDAGDKVNRSNDGLIEQLRKYVEQKNLSESKHIMQSIESIEYLLMQNKNDINATDILMEVDMVFKPVLLMEKPLFTPPVKIVFEQTPVEEGNADANTNILFEQFYIDIDLLRNNVKTLLRVKTQVSLSELLLHYKSTKGSAEILGYMQIAAEDSRHFINNNLTEKLDILNTDSGKKFELETPLVIFKR